MTSPCRRILLESSLIQHICLQFIDPTSLSSTRIRLLHLWLPSCPQVHYKGVTAKVPKSLCLFWNFKLIWLSNYAPQNSFNYSNTLSLQSMLSKIDKNPGTTCLNSPECFQKFWKVLFCILLSFTVLSKYTPSVNLSACLVWWWRWNFTYFFWRCVFRIAPTTSSRNKLYTFLKLLSICQYLTNTFY